MIASLRRSWGPGIFLTGRTDQTIPYAPSPMKSSTRYAPSTTKCSSRWSILVGVSDFGLGSDHVFYGQPATTQSPQSWSSDTKPQQIVLEVPLGGGTSDPPERSGITIKRARGDVDANELQVTHAVTQTTAPQIVGNVVSAVGTGTQVITELQTFESTWNVLLKRMDLFNKIVAGIAEVSGI